LHPAPLDVPVTGGSMRALRWGDGPRVVVGLHGISATAMSFLPVARHLGPDVSLVAPDLRGRGRSGALPAPYGLPQHAHDVVALLDHLGLDAAVVVGESMGAYVAVVLAGLHPERVERLVLVDGGLPFPDPAPEPSEPAAGPGPDLALARLQQTFPTRAAYFDHWRAHPALQGAWSTDFEAYLDYDIAESSPPELRTSISQAALLGDVASIAVQPELLPDSFTSLRGPVTLLRATRGMQDEPTPGYSDAYVARWRAEVPQLVDEVVDDTNHYTICLGDRGSRRIAAHASGRDAEDRP
jgi:pimeloyl-ACP methyl ester carboxylesterase